MYIKTLRVLTITVSTLWFLSGCTGYHGTSENYNTRDYGVMSKTPLDSANSIHTTFIHLDMLGTDRLQSKLNQKGLTNLRVLVLNDKTVIIGQPPQSVSSIQQIIGQENQVFFVSDQTAIKLMDRIRKRPTSFNSNDLQFILDRAQQSQ